MSDPTQGAKSPSKAIFIDYGMKPLAKSLLFLTSNNSAPLCSAVSSKLFADKAYLSKALWEMLFADEIQLFTKLRRNMKNHIMTMEDKILLRKRAIIETIIDELKNHCQVEHTRHRSVSNFIINILGGLTAYCFFPKKPSLNLKKVNDGQLFLNFA